MSTTQTAGCGYGDGAVTLQIEQELANTAVENVIVRVPGISLALTGMGLLGMDLVRQRVVEEERGSKLAVMAIGASGAYCTVDV